jgi:hypothetical protein
MGIATLGKGTSYSFFSGLVPVPFRPGDGARNPAARPAVFRFGNVTSYA